MLPKLVYVSGSDKASFLRVAGYGEVMNGEDDKADTAARAPFKVVEKLLGLKVINNLQGDEAMRAKAQMKRHLNTPASLQEVQSYSKETFDQFLAELESTESFSVSIYRLVVTILCHCVFGIRSELNKAHIPELMQMAHLVTNPWYSNSQIQEAAARLREISAELLQDGSVAIAPDKFIANHTGLTAEMTEEEKVDRLAGENIAGSFLAATNLADLIMKTMVAISGNRSLKEALVAELTNQETEKLDSLRQCPLLEGVYCEAQRLFSPSLIARQTSKFTTLSTIDEQKREQHTTVPPYSVLFAPIRPRLLDKHLWVRMVRSEKNY